MEPPAASGSRGWGLLKLTSWDIPKDTPPLHEEALPLKVRLSGDAELFIGRNTKAVLRLNKQLLWVSNKHFSIRHDSSSSQTFLRDLSSNGTWINGARISKEEDHALKPGDLIELAAEEGMEHRQVVFKFDLDRPLGMNNAGGSAQKRARVLSGPPSVASVASSAVGASGGSLGAPTQSLEPPAAVSSGHGAPVPMAGLASQLKEAPAAKRARAAQEAVVKELLSELAEADAATAVAWRAHADAVASAEDTAEAARDHWRKEWEAEQDGERDRLIERVSEAQIQLQRAMQEQHTQQEARKAADESARKSHAMAEAAKTSLHDAEQALQTERAKAAAAAEEAGRATAEVRRLKAELVKAKTAVGAVLDSMLIDVDTPSNAYAQGNGE